MRSYAMASETCFSNACKKAFKLREKQIETLPAVSKMPMLDTT